jgi:hypothetical protein
VVDRVPEEVRPPFHHLGLRLLLFWVTSAGFGFLLSGLLWRWQEADSEERWLRIAQLALVGLGNALGFWAVLRPASFWPRLAPNKPSVPR